MKFKKRLALPLALALFLCACTGGGGSPKTARGDTAALGDYPIQSDTELTYWVALNGNVAATASNLGDTPFAKELEKQTGIKVKYIHPALGQESEAFSLMVASNELADIVEEAWSVALGGPTTSIDDKIIVELNEYMKDYAPAFYSYLKENPDIDKAVKTDQGQYYVFPFIRGNDKLLISAGPIIRKDWLDELGMDIPKTLEDWEKMLIRFRDEKGATAPLTLQKNQKSMLFALMSTTSYFYNDDGTIKYGPLEKEYHEALKTLNRWFKEGLLDKNYTMVDSSIQDSNILNGKSGATFGSGGSGLGKWMQTMNGKDSKYDLIGVSYPYIGDVPAQYIPVQPPWGGSGAAITTACKNIPIAMKFLDYSYTEAGHILNNFGIEGKSFNYVDGQPIYTDYIMKNSEGLTVSQAMGQYNRANYLGPFVQDVRYIEQYYETDRQKEALTAWFSGPKESTSKSLPSTTFTPGENTEFSAIVNEATKYCTETTAAFISGAKSLDEYDKFIKDLKDLKIDRAIEIYQTALNRYNNRK